MKWCNRRALACLRRSWASLSSPDTLDTPFGTMEFFDGVPLPDTVEMGYDALDLLRGIDVFLNCILGPWM